MRAGVLSQIAGRDQERAARFLKRGFTAFEEGIPVADLALADGTTTTFTVSATLDAGGNETTVVLPLEVTIAALPVQTYWHAGDGHVHSKTWSDHWYYSLDSQVSYAKNDGQKFIIMTDHWKGIWGSDNDGNANWAQYHDDCTAKQNTYGIPVLPGVEIMTAADKGHALGYALGRSTVPPRDEYHTPQNLITNINNHTSGTSYAVIAHPYGGVLGLHKWGDWNVTGFRAMELMTEQAGASSTSINKWFELLRAGLPGRVAGGRFVVGMASSDTHQGRPGSPCLNWVRSTTTPLTRTAVWDAIRGGQVSASERKDLGHFTLNSAQQGGLVVAYSNTTLTFSITQKPVTGRVCMEISLVNSNNNSIWSVTNPTSQTYTVTRGAPSADTFFVVRMAFRSTSVPGDVSEVWCNPVFVDRR